MRSWSCLFPRCQILIWTESGRAAVQPPDCMVGICGSTSDPAKSRMPRARGQRRLRIVYASVWFCGDRPHSGQIICSFGVGRSVSGYPHPAQWGLEWITIRRANTPTRINPTLTPARIHAERAYIESPFMGNRMGSSCQRILPRNAGRMRRFSGDSPV